MKTSYTLLLLTIISISFFCCTNQNETDTVRKRYKIEGIKVESLPYYVNDDGDTIDISQPIVVKPTLDTTYKLHLEASPIKADEVSWYRDHVSLAKAPRIIPVQTSMWDTLVHGDTLRLDSLIIKPRTVVAKKSPLKKIAAPTHPGDTEYAITSLNKGHGMPFKESLQFTKDLEGNIWFFSGDGLLTKYDGVFIEDYRLTGETIEIEPSILYDQQQNIWLGMENGIARFDGTQFKVYEIPALQAQSYINYCSVSEDRVGNIWYVGLGGVFGYLRDSMQYSFPDVEKNNYLNLYAQSDLDNNIWIQLGDGETYPIESQIAKYDGKHIVLFNKVIAGVTDQSFSRHTIDSTGNVWMLGSLEGQATLARYNGINFQVYSIEGVDYQHDSEAKIHFTSVGTIVIIVNGKLILFDGNKFTEIGSKEGIGNSIDEMIEDETGKIWLHDADQGILFTYYPDRFEYFVKKLRSLRLGWRFLDKSGTIWAGRWNGNRISRSVNDSLYQYTLNNIVGNPVFEDQTGGVWYSNIDHSVARFRNDSITVLDMDIDFKIFKMLEGHEKELWFFSLDRIHKLDETGKTILKYKVDFVPLGDPQGFTIDHQNQIWRANESGRIIKYKEPNFTYYNFSVEKNVKQRFGASNPIEDLDGNIWFLFGRRTLLKYDGTSFWKYDFSNTLNGHLNTFVVDEKGKLWITTSEDGVALFDGQYLQYLNTNDGLLNNRTTTVVKDLENRVWVKTSSGLNIIEAIPTDEEGETYHIYTFDEKDGIMGSFFPSSANFDFSEEKVFLKGSSLAGAGFQGLLNLDELKIPATPPKHLSLAQLDINQQFIDYARLQDSQYVASLDFGVELSTCFSKIPPFLNYPLDLSLPYDLNHLTFYFTASNWAAPHKIRYSFQLQGVDSDWSLPQETPIIDYRNLPHGQHTLLARVKNESNVWSEPFAYQFIIRPPWWWSWWAYTFYFLLFSASLFGAFSLFKRRLDLRNAYKLEQQEAQRLKELDTFKSRLYTNLTHEFRTPLTVILGMVDQMRVAPKKYFDEGTLLIERNGKNLLRLINQLLDLSRLENKSLQLQMKQSDVVAYLRYVTESFQTYANGQNLSLKFFTNLESLEMDFDAEQLKQIMTNLISNAVKYTPSGRSIQVKITQLGKQLSLQVKDTGVGISAKALPHIFDRFYQVDDSSTRKGEGTGIGLAHTQELVRLMNGSIQVSSTVGEGSTFTVLLPITNKAVKEIPTPPTLKAALDFPILVDTPAVKAISSNDELPQLLIIEDNPDVVTYLRACLEEQYQIDVAYNGKIGIEKAIESVPDLIISDVMMPEKNGFEVCHILKNDERTSHIPIILLTAKADMPSKIVGLRRGADAYLSKPFLKEELLVRLEMMIEKQTKLAAYFSKIDQNKAAETVLEESAKIEQEFIQKVRQIVEKHYSDEQFGLPQLCKKIGMSRSQLYRKMKALTQTSPSAFIRTHRLQQAKHLLESTDLNVSEVAWDTGFINLAHFTKAFQEQFGMPPSKVNKIKEEE